MKIGNLDEMVRDFNNGTYNFCKGGKCTGCGKCCSNILPMTKEEIWTIMTFIRKNDIKEQKHILPVSGEYVDMLCPFMKNYGCERCTIYEVRPKVCRDFVCDPKQRPDVDEKYARKCIPIMVREVFFGG